MQEVACGGSRLFVKVAVSGLNLLVRVGTNEVLVFPINVAPDDQPTAVLVIGGNRLDNLLLVLDGGLERQGFPIVRNKETRVTARKGVSTCFNVFDELFVFVSGHKKY